MMKFSAWMETISSSVAATKDMYGELGLVAAQEVDNIKEALLRLAKTNPQAFGSVVMSIKQKLSATDRDAAQNLTGSTTGRIVKAVAAADDGQQNQ